MVFEFGCGHRYHESVCEDGPARCPRCGWTEQSGRRVVGFALLYLLVSASLGVLLAASIVGFR